MLSHGFIFYIIFLKGSDISMASIRKRGDNYQVIVSNGYDSKGKKLTESITWIPDPTKTEKQNQKDLNIFAMEFEQKVKCGKFLSGEKMSLKDFVEKWLAEYASVQLKPTTYENYKIYLDQKIIPALGHTKLAKLQPLQIQSFYNDLLSCQKQVEKGRALSLGTIKKIHGILQSVLSTAVKWQLIDTNPCDRVSLPRTEKEESIKFFTLEQTERFLSALDMEFITVYKAHTRIDDTGKPYKVSEYKEKHSLPVQHKIFFYIALFGGLRKGEIIALKWTDIDFVHCSISVNKSTARVGHEQITKSPKTKKSNREIVLPNFIIDMLKKYRIEQTKYRLSIGDQWQGNDYLFIQWNGKQMDLSTPYHTFKKIIKNYNKTVKKKELMLPNIPLHGLRHTSATLLISQNVDVRTVSNRLGHAQTSTTMNIYSHQLEEMDKLAAGTFEKMFTKHA